MAFKLDPNRRAERTLLRETRRNIEEAQQETLQEHADSMNDFHAQ